MENSARSGTLSEVEKRTLSSFVVAMEMSDVPSLVCYPDSPSTPDSTEQTDDLLFDINNEDEHLSDVTMHQKADDISSVIISEENLAVIPIPGVQQNDVISSDIIIDEKRALIPIPGEKQNEIIPSDIVQEKIALIPVPGEQQNNKIPLNVIIQEKNALFPISIEQQNNNIPLDEISQDKINSPLISSELDIDDLSFDTSSRDDQSMSVVSCSGEQPNDTLSFEVIKNNEICLPSEQIDIASDITNSQEILNLALSPIPVDNLTFSIISKEKADLTPTTEDQEKFDAVSQQLILSETLPSSGNGCLQQLATKDGPSAAIFEEETRSSWSVDGSKNAFKETVIDDNSQGSFSNQKTSQKRKCSDEEESLHAFPPEKLFEYMWPQKNGEFFFLQEHVSDYLSVKSFKRKYPELSRRQVELDEKQFLKDRGVVTETQCELGLTALRSEDVMELMSKDYPLKYKDYICVLKEKEKQLISEKRKEYAATSADRTRTIDFKKKAMLSAAEYNAHLNQERREERRACFDLQTFTIHYPVGPKKVLTHSTKPGSYPVALLPGQFQDSYKQYTPEELKYLPLNTVLYGPLKELNTVRALSEDSDSDDSSGSDGSCSSSQGTQDDSSSESEKNDKLNFTKNPTVVLEKCIIPNDTYKPKLKSNALCKVCKKSKNEAGKGGKIEELVHCSQCENSGHPSCLDLTSEMVQVLKTYPWQCMDCKICSHCRDPYDEDKMLFCDLCDRGYHTFCVGLKTLPTGKWICQKCGSCSICGASQPGPSKAQWQYDHAKTANAGDNQRPILMCQTCFKKKNTEK